MRLSLLPALGMAVALSGCVMAVPAPTAPPPVTVTFASVRLPHDTYMCVSSCAK